jgi:hypothetical protein
MKWILTAVISLGTVLLWGCGNDNGTNTNTGEGVDNPLTAAYYYDTTAVRAILTANNMGDMALTADIRNREEINGKPRVTELDLSAATLGGGTITVIPADIGAMDALTSLRLNNNASLTTLPAAIDQLDKLTTLMADSCGITLLPSQIGGMAAIKTIKLNSNNLSQLPGEIGNLTTLQALWLANNNLSALPATIVNCSSLSLINLSGNKFCAPIDATVQNWIVGIDPLWNDGQVCP